LDQAFADSRKFYLPHTLDLDGMCSRLQSLRFFRTQSRNLFKHYGTACLNSAFDIISASARAGDLIDGGHLDFPSVRRNLRQQVKLITLFREPGARVHSEYHYLRETHLRRNRLTRLDAGLRPKIASRYSFEGYLDFLLEQREAYGDLAARYVGWDGVESLSAYFHDHVFHAGLLEDQAAFAHGLCAKLGLEISFPHRNSTTTRPKEVLTAYQRHRITEIFPRDLSLYEWQCEQARSKQETPTDEYLQPARGAWSVQNSPSSFVESVWYH
jgi:hypothetical protein